MTKDVASVERQISKSTNRALFAAQDDVPIPVLPGFSPSGQAIVDEFNRERVAIYEMMANNARQQQLALEMDRMKKLLS